MSQVLALLLSLSMMMSLGEIRGDETEDDGRRYALDHVWFSMTEDQRAEAPIEIKAQAVGLTVDEFIFFSQCVEAESNRSSDDLIGRTLIALTIYNRVNDSRFEDDITGVITEGGQFEVYSSGAIYSVSRSSLSDQAILEAHNWLEEGAPYVLYFNNSGYTGEPYGYYGGNYFTLG